MSDKKRRDITLGEMQDECKKYWNNGNFGYCGKCQYMSVCCHYERYCPAQLNLTDPPRFTKSQMAAIRKSYESGVLSITRHDGMVCYQLNDFMISLTDNGIVNLLEIGETLDLAELLGKDGAE